LILIVMYFLAVMAVGWPMCKYSSDKELNKLIRSLVASGWVYIRRRKHGLLKSPNTCFQTTVPGSPSDYRAVKNFKKDIERAQHLLAVTAD
jgi:predicted RNA binding protein YcfA (HicA-like mRNA interferase family)